MGDTKGQKKMNPRMIAAIQASFPVWSIQFSQAETHPFFDEGCVDSGARVVIVVSFVDVNNVYICDVGEAYCFVGEDVIFYIYWLKAEIRP